LNNKQQLYAYPIVGRFGLGHSLLAWARCVVWSTDHNAQRIAPQWLQLRLGTYIRREQDKRFYFSLFQRGNQIGGVHRLLLLANTRKVRITDWKESFASDGSATIVIFENLNHKNEATYLHEILGRSTLVRSALIDMTRVSARPKLISKPHVAIHVRGGDFTTVVDPKVYSTGVHNLRLPMEWYAQVLKKFRYQLGFDIPAIVYSDCKDHELSSLLSLPHVTRSRRAGAVTDLLSIAQAPAMISSGSGFSRWGAYLGQVPRICFPGQRAFRMLDGYKGVELEPECMDEIPEAFVSHVKASMNTFVARLNRI
jgi:hypothetical protein